MFQFLETNPVTPCLVNGDYREQFAPRPKFSHWKLPIMITVPQCATCYATRIGLHALPLRHAVIQYELAGRV